MDDELDFTVRIVVNTNGDLKDASRDDIDDDAADWGKAADSMIQ